MHDRTEQIFTDPSSYNLLSSVYQEFNLRLVEILRLRCPHARTVYDLGCGIGDFTHLLAHTFTSADVFGVDMSEEYIKHAQREYSSSNLTFFISDVTTFVAEHRYEPKSILVAKWSAHLFGGQFFRFIEGNDFDATAGIIERTPRSFRTYPNPVCAEKQIAGYTAEDLLQYRLELGAQYNNFSCTTIGEYLDVELGEYIAFLKSRQASYLDDCSQAEINAFCTKLRKQLNYISIFEEDLIYIYSN